MSTTTTWSIQLMNTSTQTINGFSEVVLTATWKCFGTDDSTPPNSYTVYGQCNFQEPSSGSSFTPYNQLTQDQVLGWCWANGVDKTGIEDNVSLQIANMQNLNETVLPNPWAGA